MPLSAGTRLGPYEILAPLGAGGMGEVYKARDTQLDRDVAIKVLPRALSNDPERLARFDREAKILAALNHPNIAIIHGMVEADGQRALVMELVPGETLAAIVKRGPMSVKDASKVARQIAEALEAAHDKGVVHRDLKPGNVMVTPAGLVKVLDFGLAAMVQPTHAVHGDGTLSPTLTMGGTIAGTILGTASYMSPEQAEGLQADKRADIWSYGVVLWEMLTGKRLFEAESVSRTLADVLRMEIDFSKAPAFQPLLRRCLDRDLRNRLRDIGEARVAIDHVGQAALPAAASQAASRPRYTWVPWAVAALVALVALITLPVAFVHFRETPPPAPLIASIILPPEAAAFDFSASDNPPALSPDGKWIVFGVRTADNKTPLWIRPLSSTTAQILPGTDGARFPFWSPDSRYVAFFAGTKLKRIDISGGPALAIAEAAEGGRGGSWSPQDVILFTPDNHSPLLRITASGGTPSPATTLEPTKSRSHRLPWFLPDGRHFLFEDQVGNQDGEDLGIRVGSLDSKETVLLGMANSNAVYSSGHLLFLRENTLMAQPFDANTRAVKGEAVPVAEQVAHVLSVGRGGVFTVSASGLLVYETGGSVGGRKLTWFDRNGHALGTPLGEPGNFGSLELSPDRKSAAVSVGDTSSNGDIWIYDIARNLPTKFTFDPGADLHAVWSPDGATLIWDARRNGKRQLYRRAADGKGAEELLFEGPGIGPPGSWSPDGKLLLFTNSARNNNRNGRGVFVLPLTPEKPGEPLKPTALIDTAFVEQDGVLSPDGHWVAYVSDESQQPQVYVTQFPVPGGKHQISTAAGGTFPRWRHDGREVFYVGLDGKLMAAEVTLKAGSIDVGQVRPLGIPVPLNVGIPYDVSLDGQRILAITEPERPASAPLTLVENWTGLLKK